VIKPANKTNGYWWVSFAIKKSSKEEQSNKPLILGGK
jgi:hypothetical protein